jgi:hypothetical protein
MVQSALALGPGFEGGSVSLATGGPRKLTGSLRAEPTLVEMPVVAAPTRRRSGRACRIRAFRIQGDELSCDGLFDGDYVLVGDQRCPPAGSMMIAQNGGRPVLKRVTPHARQAASGSSLPRDPKILGILLGIIRERASRRRPSMPASNPISATKNFVSPPTRAHLLRSRLVMLESTCAGTSNPRLQRALRNEAKLVRQQLQNESATN